MSAIIKSIRSFRFAFKGLYVLFKEEHNMRIHTLIASLAVVLGILFRIEAHEWCLIVLCIGAVMTSEAFNSCIERLVDGISSGQNKWAGTIKDLAAAGVLLISLTAALTGLIIFIPKIVAIL